MDTFSVIRVQIVGYLTKMFNSFVHNSQTTPIFT